jgi:hypothetical protein
MNKISYSAVVLDEESASTLKREFIDKVPSGWEWIGHHMTIKMGELPDNLKPQLGQEVDLLVVELGIDERAMAVKVADQGLSTNPVPHITLAVNRAGGGKPFHSNKIPSMGGEDEPHRWPPVENRFKISGTIQEIPQK